MNVDAKFHQYAARRLHLIRRLYGYSLAGFVGPFRQRENRKRRNLGQCGCRRVDSNRLTSRNSRWFRRFDRVGTSSSRTKKPGPAPVRSCSMTRILSDGITVVLFSLLSTAVAFAADAPSAGNAELFARLDANHDGFL